MGRNRLEFEPELIAEITTTTPRRGGSPRGVWLLTFPVVVLLAAAIALIGAVTEPGIGFFLFARTNPNLIAMATDLTDALASPHPARVMDLFVSPGPGNPTGTAHDRLIVDMRHDLEEQGLRWDAVRSVAVIGVLARARNDQADIRNAQLFTGEVVFESNGALFSVEVTARRLQRQFRLVDIWHWHRINESDLAAYAAQQFHHFEQDPGDPQSGTQLSRIRQVNLSL